MSAIPQDHVTIVPPPGYEVVDWLGFVREDGNSSEAALKELRKKAGEKGANWIIQMNLQNMPGKWFATGLAVRMRKNQ